MHNNHENFSKELTFFFVTDLPRKKGREVSENVFRTVNASKDYNLRNYFVDKKLIDKNKKY